MNRNFNININIITACIRQMGQQQSTPEPHSARNYHFQSNTEVKNQFKSNKVKQHEGILKLRSTPFPNCVQISNDGMLLFLQNAQATLYELLQTRLYTNQLFPLEDVERLIENVVYTLAFLEESNVSYRDLCQFNIYYCNGVFKLLPNELIEQTIYDRSWQNFYGLHQQPSQQQQSLFPYLSPELIIALRMKQKSINDSQILNKSNVFILGLILLEATTLLPSTQCYDTTNYDIFNNIITERLDLVEEHYNECIARIVANMLDYDFNQRMDLKELSIWVNRELAANRNGMKSNFETEEKKTIVPSKSTLTIQKSRYIVPEAEKQQPVVVESIQAPPQETLPARSYSRSNMVYITGYEDGGKDDSRYSESVKGAKNFIYLESLPQYQVDYQIDKKMDERHMIQPLDLKSKLGPGLKSIPEYTNNPKTFNFNRYNNYQKQDKYSKYVDQNEQQHQNYAEEPKLTRNYADNLGYAAYVAPQSAYLREVANYRHKLVDEQREIKKAVDSAETFKDQSLLTSKMKGQNKYYPSMSEMQNAQRQIESTKRISKHSEVGKNSRAKQTYDSKQSRQSRQSDSKCSINDGSINRIKMEIEKSRKLIEEFRKTEGITQ